MVTPEPDVSIEIVLKAFLKTKRLPPFVHRNHGGTRSINSKSNDLFGGKTSFCFLSLRENLGHRARYPQEIVPRILASEMGIG